ncbi:transposase [Arenimonas sp. MALMAid1274]|uniref:transposase n=1 Tax=Arenimonas sp. MALMAid1274 TaxID=3411630 RepID=UPI003BA315A6
MPVFPRIDVPGVPLHIVQRGVDRQPCFVQASNFWRYLDDLQIASRRHQCAVHAYVLMDNHVHLLVTGTEPGSPSRMMQQLGRRYVRYFNSFRQRTGTLWEGRFRSCLVDSDAYFLRCQRYIELNPVRAAMVATPGSWRWSSYRHHAWGDPDIVATPHTNYLALGLDEDARRRAYIALIAEGVPAKQIEEIRAHTQQGRAWGGRKFQSRIASTLSRNVAVVPRGRPSQRR